MGCGSSAGGQEPEKKNKEEYDEMMGKKIPKFLLETPQTSVANRNSVHNNSDIETHEQDQKQRQAKKLAKKIRGDDNNETIYENVEKVQRPAKEHLANDLALMKASFKNHFVFFNLSAEAVDNLMQSMFYCTVKEREFIFKQGDQASCYFIVESGQIEVEIDGKPVRSLKQGDSFGEIALLYSAPRSASIKTLTASAFWALDRGTFRRCIESLTSKEYEENRKFIDQVTFFSFMTVEQRDAIARTLITTKFSPGQPIVNEGDRADSYYVIKQGQVSIWKGDKMLRKMGPKDSFGYHEQALYISSVRGASVKAETETKCVTLGRETLTSILGDKVQIIVFNNLMRWSFEKSETLKLLTKIQLEKIAQNAKINNYKVGDVIFPAGSLCDKIVIVLEGTMASSSQSYEKGQCFGDGFIRKESRQTSIPSDIKMKLDGVLAILPINQLFQLIGGDFETVLIKNENSHEKKIQQLGSRADASHIKVEDLVFIQKLGAGQFGWVYLVKHKADKDATYALKSISKASIIEQNLEKHILQEKAVLELVHFPFIMEFVRTFKDDISVYFLVQYIRGMELFDVIREIGLLRKFDTQFYVATMILCLEYLHKKAIVYRDLKPENIMVDDKGYMYLIDLGTAKPLAKARNNHTFTIIGTPHYMAPEIILGKGYSYNVDLWSVGVCMYEFLCGGVPYAEDLDDPYEIYEVIMNTQLNFGKYIKDRAAIRLIEQLLQKQPEARLGSSYAGLKAHAWFDDFDWDKLFSRELPPPYIPPAQKLISDIDVQKNFRIGKPVVNVIKLEQQDQKIKTSKKAKNQNWDEDF